MISKYKHHFLSFGLINCIFITCLNMNCRFSVGGELLQSGVYTYSISSNQVTIIDIYSESVEGSKFVIPTEVDHLPVRHVGDEAYYDVYTMQSLIIPDHILSIGKWSFSHCLSLTNVAIGMQVASIGRGPFVNCTNLQAIVVSDSNTCYSSSNGVLFDKHQTTLLQYPGGKAGAYVVPGSVTNIAEAAFFACPQLTGVAISSNVTFVGAHAFGRCGSLPSMTIPDGVTAIEEQTFFGCTNLSSVVVGQSVTNIGDYAFKNCTSLAGAYFRGDAPTLGTNVFLNATPTIYHLEEASGFGETFGGRPTEVWTP